jgi:hypothetical protein
MNDINKTHKTFGDCKVIFYTSDDGFPHGKYLIEFDKPKINLPDGIESSISESRRGAKLYTYNISSQIVFNFPGDYFAPVNVPFSSKQIFSCFIGYNFGNSKCYKLSGLSLENLEFVFKTDVLERAHKKLTEDIQTFYKHHLEINNNIEHGIKSKEDYIKSL